MVFPAEFLARQFVDDWVPDFEYVDGSTAGTPADPVLSFLGVSDLVGEQVIGGSPVRFNARGMRGNPVVSPKPARMRRILVTGSGVPFGLGVTDEETFGQVAVDTLGGVRIGLEAVNSARPGFSSVQIVNLMEMRGWATEPDLVIVGDNRADWELGAFPDEELLAPVRLEGEFARTLASLALFRIVDFQFGVLRDGKSTLRSRAKSIGGGAQSGARFRVGTNAFAQVLEKIVSRARDHEAEVIFVVYPTPGDVAFGHVPKVVQQYRMVLGEAGKRLGVPVMDGSRAIADSDRSREELFIDEEHPSALGHRLLGQAMARSLRGWIRGSRVETKGTGEPVPRYSEPKLGDL
jgi:hypothetical protein